VFVFCRPICVYDYLQIPYAACLILLRSARASDKKAASYDPLRIEHVYKGSCSDATSLLDLYSITSQGLLRDLTTFTSRALTTPQLRPLTTTTFSAMASCPNCGREISAKTILCLQCTCDARMVSTDIRSLEQRLRLL